MTGIDTTNTLGQVTDNGDGTFNYDPNGQFDALDAGETATDVFGYTISDGEGGTSIATVEITITGIDDAPGGDLNIIDGDNSSNFLKGTSANDQINGFDGHDKLLGDAGDDQLLGGEGSDVLWGGSGNDLLVGGNHNDLLFGGDGQDHFVLQTDSGSDLIFDYHDGTDTLGLAGDLVFEDLTIRSGGFGTTVIEVEGDRLATLLWVSPDAIDASDFAGFNS